MEQAAGSRAFWGLDAHWPGTHRGSDPRETALHLLETWTKGQNVQTDTSGIHTVTLPHIFMSLTFISTMESKNVPHVDVLLCTLSNHCYRRSLIIFRLNCWNNTHVLLSHWIDKCQKWFSPFSGPGARRKPDPSLPQISLLLNLVTLISCKLNKKHWPPIRNSWRELRIISCQFGLV